MQICRPSCLAGDMFFFLMDEANNTELMRRMLLERMEKRVGRSIRTPRDFDFLAMRIYEATNMQVSISTLKGYGAM